MKLGADLVVSGATIDIRGAGIITVDHVIAWPAEDRHRACHLRAAIDEDLIVSIMTVYVDALHGVELPVECVGDAGRLRIAFRGAKRSEESIGALVSFELDMNRVIAGRSFDLERAFRSHRKRIAAEQAAVFEPLDGWHQNPPPRIWSSAPVKGYRA